MTRSQKLAVAAEPLLAGHAVEEHRAELYRFILKRVRDPEAAEDIVQDVLVKAFVQQGTLAQPSRLRAWLYQITRNAIVDHYRLQRPAEAVPDDLLQETAGEDDNPLQWELARCLLPLLAELPDPYRQALRLAEFEGVPQREVASQLGLSLSGAKSRVQRARKMLLAVLLKCCRVEQDRRGGVVDYETRGGCDGCRDQSPRRAD